MLRLGGLIVTLIAGARARALFQKNVELSKHVVVQACAFHLAV